MVFVGGQFIFAIKLKIQSKLEKKYPGHIHGTCNLLIHAEIRLLHINVQVQINLRFLIFALGNYRMTRQVSYTKKKTCIKCLTTFLGQFQNKLLYIMLGSISFSRVFLQQYFLYICIQP